MIKHHDSNLLTAYHIIDKYDKEAIERSYNTYLLEKDIIEIENLVHDHLVELIAQRKRKYEETMKIVRTSDYVIEKLDIARVYSKAKESPKFLTNRHEYNRMLSFLDESEKSKVVGWVEDNGGFENILAPEWK